MPGYSGTPLVKKLGIRDRFRIAVLNLPVDAGAELEDAFARCEVSRDRLDFAMIFVTTKAELVKQFSKFSKRLAPTGMLWVSWPKKSSGVASDLTENGVRAIGLDAGLVDIKVCAVTEIWSGLKFVIRLKDRKGM
ncbi:MAG: DUF3052 domain-containing protein [Terriglobales bacterium]